MSSKSIVSKSAFQRRMGIQYDHANNLHTVTGPQVAFPLVFGGEKICSLLDVGCGTGNWLKAARDYGITDVVGIDGIVVPDSMRLVPLDILRQHDLRTEWGLGRRFSAVLCLEVAEHLDSQFEHSLIRGLTNHSDLVVFSAACPGQPGQHHVNCQWPEHWQSIFNSFGFWCSDAIRWDLWMLEEIEPWYRQNMFIARYDPRRAGNEPRIRPVIHPAMAQELIDSSIATSLTRSLTRQVGEIEQGSMQTSWYFKVPLTGLLGKASRLLKSKRQAEP